MASDSESRMVVSKRERLGVGLLTLMGPGAGHFYLGRIKRALVVLGVAIIVYGLCIALVTSPFGMAWPLYLGLAMILLVPIVALIDALRLTRSGKATRPTSNTVRIILSLGFVLCVSGLSNWGISLIKDHYAHAYRMPTGGMMPSLLAGDFFYVDMKVYKSRDPQRGEIAVLHFPKDPSIDYIKRIVGLPGDMIEYREEVLYVNGERVTSEYLPGVTQEDSGHESKFRRETFPDFEYLVMCLPSMAKRRGETAYKVPVDNYYCLGDNRNNSVDSRHWGPVPRENMVGPATHIYFSLNMKESSVRWERIGNRIQ